MMQAGGLILCGGQSKRMGRPKAWLPFGQEVLLQRVVRIVAEVVGPVVVVAAENQDVPLLPQNVELIRDPVAQQGPLFGLITGLRAISGRADAVYLSACDHPMLTSSWIRQILVELSDADIAIPNVGGKLHPLAAAYRVDLLGVAESLFRSGHRRMMDLCAAANTRELPKSHFLDLMPLTNLNSPEDLARLGFAEPASGS
jgi:molybdenum cofactor guanylyltransferase